jgi:hypothetical protein
MGTKLGEALLERGVITQEQLKRALDAQLVFGGHLGTCMVELGYVDERPLGEVLAATLGVRYAPPEVFEHIPASVIDLLPAPLVERHKVIPFSQLKKKLELAMIDPHDFSAIDEISFATGLTVRPWVSPEIRIVHAMETYYGIRRRLRFVAICRELDRRRALADPGATQEREDRPPAEASAPLQDPRDPIAPAKVEPSVPEISAAEAPADGECGHGYGRSWREVANEIFGEEYEGPRTPRAVREAPQPVPAPQSRTAPQPGSAPHPEPAPADETRSDLDGLSRRLCRAESTDGIAEALLDFASEMTSRSILFNIRSAQARIWRAKGVGLSEDYAERVHIPVTGEPLFRLLAGNEFYKGLLPEGRACDGFFEALGLDRPFEILLWPVYVEDRLVALFYGDGGQTERIRGDIAHFRRLMRKLGLSLRLLILKSKIHAA